jgi:hypothetical protein
MPQEERRRAKRFHEENVAEIFFISEDGESKPDSSQAYTENISIDGAKLVCGMYFSVSTRLKLSLKLSHSKQDVLLWTTVKWIKEREKDGKYEMGVEFVHDAKTIAVFMKHLYGKKKISPAERGKRLSEKRIEVT